jgi:hypothetical protein
VLRTYCRRPPSHRRYRTKGTEATGCAHPALTSPEKNKSNPSALSLLLYGLQVAAGLLPCKWQTRGPPARAAAQAHGNRAGSPAAAAATARGKAFCREW